MGAFFTAKQVWSSRHVSSIAYSLLKFAKTKKKKKTGASVYILREVNYFSCDYDQSACYKY